MSENSKNTLLKKIQQYNFAAYDMLLYLDTHPDDKEAFEMYRELMMTYMKLLNDYQKTYGPLTIEGAAATDASIWHNAPWPWEKNQSAQCTGGKEN